MMPPEQSIITTPCLAFNESQTHNLPRYVNRTRRKRGTGIIEWHLAEGSPLKLVIKNIGPVTNLFDRIEQQKWKGKVINS